MIYKGHKISLKLISLIRRINVRVQHLTCFSIYHRVTIHQNIYLKPVPSEFPHGIIHQRLVVHCFIDELLLSEFIQEAMKTGVSGAKIMMVSLMASSSSSFVFIQFQRGIFNFFANSNNDVLFIYYKFCNPQAGYKSLFCLPFTPQKIHHHHHHHHHRSTSYIVGFLHWCVYTEDDNFYLVCRQNRSLTLLLHCNICCMEHLDHKNLSLCVLSTF